MNVAATVRTIPTRTRRSEQRVAPFVTAHETILMMVDPLVTAIEAALSDTVAWREPAYLSDTVQSLVAAGEYRKAAVVMAPRIRSLVDVGSPEPSTRTRQLSSREGYEAWKASTDPVCIECGGGKGLGHTTDCPAVAGDRADHDAGTCTCSPRTLAVYTGPISGTAYGIPGRMDPS